MATSLPLAQLMLSWRKLTPVFLSTYLSLNWIAAREDWRRAVQSEPWFAPALSMTTPVKVMFCR